MGWLLSQTDAITDSAHSKACWASNCLCHPNKHTFRKYISVYWKSKASIRKYIYVYWNKRPVKSIKIYICVSIGTSGHLIGNSSAVFLGHQRAFFARNFLALFSEKQIIKICSLQGCVICVSIHIVYINGSDLLTRRSSHSSSLMVSQTLIEYDWGPLHWAKIALFFVCICFGNLVVKLMSKISNLLWNNFACLPWNCGALLLCHLGVSLNILWWTEVVKSVLLRF